MRQDKINEANTSAELGQTCDLTNSRFLLVLEEKEGGSGEIPWVSRIKKRGRRNEQAEMEPKNGSVKRTWNANGGKRGKGKAPTFK